MTKLTKLSPFPDAMVVQHSSALEGHQKLGAPGMACNAERRRAPGSESEPGCDVEVKVLWGP